MAPPQTSRRREREDPASGPASDSDSDLEPPSSISSSFDSYVRGDGDGERAQKRLVGESADSAAAADEAEIAPRDGEDRNVSRSRFRHFGWMRRVRVACLMFCFEEVRRRDRGGSDSAGLQLSALPPELVEVIGRFLVANSAVVLIAQPENLEYVATLPTLTADDAMAILTGPDGRQFLAVGMCVHAPGADTFVVKLWDVVSRDYAATLEGHTDYIHALAPYSDNGVPVLASGSSDKRIILWGVPGGDLLAKLSGHTDGVSSLAVFTGPAGQPCLASGSSDGEIRLWDLRARTALATLSHGDWVASLCVFSDPAGTEFLVSGGIIRSRIAIWNLATRELACTLASESSAARESALFTDAEGVPMLVGAGEGTITVWDLVSREVVATMEGVSEPSGLTIFAGANGRVLLACFCGLVSGPCDTAGRFYDLSSQSTICEIDTAVSGVAFRDSVSGAPVLVLGEHDIDANGGFLTHLLRLWTSRS
jgi:WD domain, G-beta repeat